jgi:iron complex transport system substrate-binding protein
MSGKTAITKDPLMTRQCIESSGANRLITRRAFAGFALGALAGWPALASAQTPQASPTSSWTFTDDRGITVTLPKRPDRVIAQIGAAAALWDYGVRLIAVFGPQYSEDGSLDSRVGDVDLAAVESVGQLWGEFDLERALVLDADLIVTPMWVPPSLWFVSEETQAAMEGKIPSIAIQTAQVSAFEAIARYAALAEALGADMESPENVAAKAEFDAAVADLRDAIAAKPGLHVMLAAGDAESFYVGHPDFMAQFWSFRDLGLDIVQNDVDDFWETLSWEEVHKYPADLILIDVRDGTYGLDDFAGVATWKSVPAAQADQVVAWNLEPVLSYASFAKELRLLSDLVRNARADLV